MTEMLAAPIDPNLTRLQSSESALANIKKNLGNKSPEAFDNAAKEFESMFLNEMLGHMFSTTEVDPMFGGGQSEEIWRDMMVDAYSKNIVQSGGIGLSDAIKSHMIALQEKADQ